MIKSTEILANDKQMQALHDAVLIEVAVANAVIFAQKAYSLEKNKSKHEESQDLYNKAIILLENGIKIKRKLFSSSIVETLALLMKHCQIRKQSLSIQLYKKLSTLLNYVSSIQDDHKFYKPSKEQNLRERLHCKDFSKVVEQWNIMLNHGGWMTKRVYISTEILRSRIGIIQQKLKIDFFKQIIYEIDKVQVLYKFTPDCDLNRLIFQLVQNLARLYKENKEINQSMNEGSNLVKQYVNKLVNQIAGKEEEEELDIVIITSQLIKSTYILWLFITQKEIDQKLKVFLKKFIGEFIFELIIQDIYLYIASYVNSQKL